MTASVLIRGAAAALLGSAATLAGAAPLTVYLQPVELPWALRFEAPAGHAVHSEARDDKSTEAVLMGPVIVSGTTANNQVLRYAGQGGAAQSGTTAGATVSAGAVLALQQTHGQPTPAPPHAAPDTQASARAQTGTLGGVQGQTLVDFWTSRVETRTNRAGLLAGNHTYQNQYQCASATDPNGTVFCLTDPVTVGLGTNSHHEASAESWWMDTWTPSADTLVTLSFGVHMNLGQVFGDRSDAFIELTPGQLTAQGFAGGPLQDIQEQQRADVGVLLAGLGVWDLSLRSPMACAEYPELPPALQDEGCPEAVASHFVQATTALRDLMEAGGTLEVDTVFELQFLALAGHAYRVVGGIEAQTSDGADLDGFNTFTLKSVALTNGATLTSSAAMAFGLQLPGSAADPDPDPDPTAVPAPPTVALLLLGALGLALRRCPLGPPAAGGPGVPASRLA
ncbi:MAG: hypothetical protein QM750_10645 [Rubrivivax sp.]